jgi:sugar/nucleoside kinase (ribokinase family)
MLDGEAIEDALRVANACGAAAVSVVGDAAGLPDRAELDRLVSTDSEHLPDTIR